MVSFVLLNKTLFTVIIARFKRGLFLKAV